MRINSLKLYSYRNYPELSIKFDNQIIFLEGMNGQGKTNLVEAISVLALLKSFRTSNYDLLINSQNNSFFIDGDFVNATNQKINVKLSYKDKKKQITLDGKKIKKFSDYWGMIPLVSLIPEEGIITSGAPGERRSFFDQFLSLIFGDYLLSLQSYLSILKQKNNLLSDLKINQGDKKLLVVYNQQIAEYADLIVNKRIKLLKDYQPLVLELINSINPAITSVELEYLSSINTENYKIDFLNKLNESQNLEIRRGVSLYGPHKDDFVFKINGYNLKNFGSKGQHKIFLVALKLAQAKLMKKVLKEYPIFILDDLFNEIDGEKCHKIAKLLDSDLQTFITTCDFAKKDYFNQQVTQIIKIDNGLVNYEL